MSKGSGLTTYTHMNYTTAGDEFPQGGGEVERDGGSRLWPWRQTSQGLRRVQIPGPADTKAGPVGLNARVAVFSFYISQAVPRSFMGGRRRGVAKSMGWPRRRRAGILLSHDELYVHDKNYVSARWAQEEE